MNNNYFQKYLKYKNKYLKYKNLTGGSSVTNQNFELVDELSYDTKMLLTTRVFINVSKEWKSFDYFVSIVKEFGIPIIEIKNAGREWGQDLIKIIQVDKDVGNGILKLTNKDPFKDKLISEIKEILPNFNIFIPTIKTYDDKNKETNVYNLEKGGNFITLPNFVEGKLPPYEFDEDPSIVRKKVITLLPYEPDLFYDDFCTTSYHLCLRMYIPDFKLENYYGEEVFHIDEILTLIPYGPGKDDYNIWFYNPVCEDVDYERKLKEIFNFNYLTLKNFFPEEKIILFELYFSPKGKIIHPPIFNRIILRKDSRFRIIFPDQPQIVKDKVILEMKKYKKIYNDIDYFFIDTKELHQQYGNIHCGFKNIPLF